MNPSLARLHRMICRQLCNGKPLRVMGEGAGSATQLHHRFLHDLQLSRTWCRGYIHQAGKIAVLISFCSKSLRRKLEAKRAITEVKMRCKVMVACESFFSFTRELCQVT